MTMLESEFLFRCYSDPFLHPLPTGTCEIGNDLV